MRGQGLKVKPDSPQRRLGGQVAETIRRGGVILYPTDSYYALGCAIGDAKAVERIRAIRDIPPDHHLTLGIKDLSDISSYAMLGNSDFRFIKSCMPGPFTFIMRATKQVPERLSHPKRKTIGVRCIDSKVVAMLLEELREPLITSTFGADEPDAEGVDEIMARAEGLVDIMVDSGPCANEPTTVVDMTQTPYSLVRQGAGRSPALLEEESA